jgi:hypothetical protein
MPSPVVPAERQMQCVSEERIIFFLPLNQFSRPREAVWAQRVFVQLRGGLLPYVHVLLGCLPLLTNDLVCLDIHPLTDHNDLDRSRRTPGKYCSQCRHRLGGKTEFSIGRAPEKACGHKGCSLLDHYSCCCKSHFSILRCSAGSLIVFRVLGYSPHR